MIILNFNKFIFNCYFLDINQNCFSFVLILIWLNEYQSIFIDRFLIIIFGSICRQFVNLLTKRIVVHCGVFSLSHERWSGRISSDATCCSYVKLFNYNLNAWPSMSFDDRLNQRCGIYGSDYVSKIANAIEKSRRNCWDRI